MIYQGAEAYGILEFQNVDKSTRYKVSTAMGASGTGWKANTKVDAAVNNQTAAGKLKIVFS